MTVSRLYVAKKFLSFLFSFLPLFILHSYLGPHICLSHERYQISVCVEGVCRAPRVKSLTVAFAALNRRNHTCKCSRGGLNNMKEN